MLSQILPRQSLWRTQSSPSKSDCGLWPRVEADLDIHCAVFCVDRLVDARIPVPDFLVGLLHKAPGITGVVYIAWSQGPFVFQSSGCPGIQPANLPISHAINITLRNANQV